ncbi:MULTISPECIES: GNAT family N-acetyltransferase [Kribbella]|uniref:N-acetyltransferase domain-containing protein n=1 Tax=Kribbella karoonensis TaxID=324851 RepID=A0ABP4Q4R6_9ACTN
MELTTQRLTLRRPIESDFQMLCELWTDPRVARFMDDYGPRDIPSVREWLDLHADGASENGTHLQLILTRHATPVGWLGLGESDSPIAAWSFGYAIHPAHRSHGYATEALTAALTYCHRTLGVPTLWGECHPPNKASAHVMLTAGLQELPPTPTSRRFLYTPPRPRAKRSRTK